MQPNTYGYHPPNLTIKIGHMTKSGECGEVTH